MKKLLWMMGLLLLASNARAQDPDGTPMALEEFRTYLAINPYDQEPIATFTSRIAEETNPNVRAHYLAISYVGFWLQGEGESARKAYTILKNRHPDSFYLEQLHPDRMWKACPDCRRAVQRQITCPVCRGTNLCPTCKGKKQLIRMGRSKPCTTCNATGQCTNCDRRGFVKTGTCATCGGEGRVVNRERLMIAYKHLLTVDAARITSGKRIRIFGAGRGSEAPKAEPE